MITNAKIANRFEIGAGQPLTVIAGPCVIESQDLLFEIAETMVNVCAELGINYVFKASFDKANRTSINSFRGPGLEKGLEMLQAVKDKYNVPLLTDIHESYQVKPVAEVVDILQIPAFLCRQTDLLVAAAATDCVINVKKGQFLAPRDMAQVINKIKEGGSENITLTERGYTFGYNNMVVDMRSLAIMRDLGCPVVMDATHSVQLPGGQGNTSGGERQFVPVLARAAAAVGIDALFMETHPNPAEAKSDGANSMPLNEVKELLSKVVEIDKLVR